VKDSAGVTGIIGTCRSMMTRGLAGEGFSASLFRFNIVEADVEGLMRAAELAVALLVSNIPISFLRAVVWLSVANDLE